MKKTITAVAVVAALGLAMPMTLAADELKEIFKQLDTDADGFVSKQEAESDPDLLDSFDDGDNNEDGKLDMAEFEKMDVADE